MSSGASNLELPTVPGVDGCQPILRQTSVPPPVNDDIRLLPQSQYDHTTECHVETDLNAAIAAVGIQIEGSGR